MGQLRGESTLQGDDSVATALAIRLADESDAKVLAQLRFSFRSKLTRPAELVESEASFVERCAVWMQQRLRSENVWKCLLAEDGTIVIGNVWLQMIEKIPNPSIEPEHHVYLTNFYVRPEWQGKGVGSRLLAAALDWSRANKCHVVFLWSTQQSTPLYRHAGFSTDNNFLQVQ